MQNHEIRRRAKFAESAETSYARLRQARAFAQLDGVPWDPFASNKHEVAFLRLPHVARPIPPDDKQQKVRSAFEEASATLKLLGYDASALCKKWAGDCDRTKPVKLKG